MDLSDSIVPVHQPSHLLEVEDMVAQQHMVEGMVFPQHMVEDVAALQHLPGDVAQ